VKLVRPAAAVVSTLLIVACGVQPTANVASPAASAAPATPRATPAVDLHCSLPVIALSTAGFVDFPAGTFRPDPAAPANLLAGGYVFAWGVHRWVKAPPGLLAYQALSPDGTALAMLETPRAGSTGVAVLDLKTGASRHVGQIAGAGARIIAFRAGGIYLAEDLVFRMDATTGAVTVIGPDRPGEATAKAGLWNWVTPTDAWYALLPQPQTGGGDSVLSLSLADGKLTHWYTAPANRAVSILGFVTPSEPLVVEYGSDAARKQMPDIQFKLLKSPGVIQRLGFGSSPQPAPFGVADDFGVWLTTGGHLWLYDRGGLEPMANVSAAIGPGVSPTPLGACH